MKLYQIEAIASGANFGLICADSPEAAIAAYLKETEEGCEPIRATVANRQVVPADAFDIDSMPMFGAVSAPAARPNR